MADGGAIKAGLSYGKDDGGGLPGNTADIGTGTGVGSGSAVGTRSRPGETGPSLISEQSAMSEEGGSSFVSDGRGSGSMGLGLGLGMSPSTASWGRNLGGGRGRVQQS